MFLQACLNGSRPPGDHERLPLTPDELARDAAEVAEAGAVSVHVHPRGPDGLESLEPEHCGAAVSALREAAPELEISLSTGLWITDGDVARRLECVRGWTELPDCVSVNVIEEGWEDLVALLDGRGIGIESGSGRRSTRGSSPPRGWRGAAGARSSSRRRPRRRSRSSPPARSTAGSSATTSA